MAVLDAQTVTLPAEATFGRVIAELAGELDRLHRRRASLTEEIEGVSDESSSTIARIFVAPDQQ